MASGVLLRKRSAFQITVLNVQAPQDLEQKPESMLAMSTAPHELTTRHAKAARVMAQNYD